MFMFRKATSMPPSAQVTSALLALDGWTTEEMIVKKPAALHVFWPRMELNTTPKEQASDKAKWKSLDEQANLGQFVRLPGRFPSREEVSAQFPQNVPLENSICQVSRMNVPGILDGFSLRTER